VPFPAGPSTLTHQIAKRAAEASSKAGYFCFDEMFIWARALIEDCPSIAPLLQHRFPLVIVDEMQDTSDLQVGILESVFPRSSSEVVLQRVGDPNQAIYDGVRNVSSVLDVFPDAATCLKIPNSFRFGPAIATLASPFAIDAAGPDGLQGIGPRSVDGAPKCCPNALLIFQDDEAHRVLDAYGQHVLSTFDDETLAIGDVTAMGARHKDATDVRVGHAHFPKTVSHYWSGYTAEVARRDPHPRTLIQYVRTARALVRDACDLSPGVNKIASGLERIGQSAGSGDALGRRIPGHRTLVEILATNTEALSAYRHLLRVCLIEWEVLTEKLWERLRPDILLIVTGLSGSGTPLNSLDGFLDWDTDKYSFVVPGTASPKDVGPNVYRVDSGAGRSVDIRLGSVHSMKGQTHLATLLLNTYVRGHSAKRMLPWLLGEKVNLSGAGAEDRLRLQQTYVAMTRPSHLICLAIPVSVLGDDVTGYVSILQDRGWHAANVVDGAPCWIE
jgi:DNA helicase-2/ATP-dependent DNA helicase PcrA